MTGNDNADRPELGLPPLSPALASRNPVAWLAVFGPGAIIASLTIATGELVFSSRAGALFGCDILWLFLLTCILKWVLLFSAARHMVLSGHHPLERWAYLPGPRGWLPVLLFLLAVVAFPVWFGFVAGVLGTLAEYFLAIDAHLWGAAFILLITVLALYGGYTALERIQLVIVVAMLAAVGISLVLLRPDWLDILRGLFIPQAVHYPSWLPEASPEISQRPVWVETITYVGVIGGSGYDYLAYVSFLRNKNWGFSGRAPSASELAELTSTSGPLLRSWVRAPLIDCTVSFLVVLVFSTVFVVCGSAVLAPQHSIPNGDDLLSLQAQFVTNLHPWLLPLYVAGATLALMGTLYGVLEVGPAIVRETLQALRPGLLGRSPVRLRRWTIYWVSGGGLVVLAWSYIHTRVLGGQGQPPALVDIITPANLFTGVLCCGFICLLNPWVDTRFLPPSLRMPWPLRLLNTAAGLVFIFLGTRAYWDFAAQKFPDLGGGWLSVPIFLATLAVGWIAAYWVSRKPS